jgi:hypothetical protein
VITVDWQRADPTTEIEGCIARLRDDQRANVAIAERAHLAELNAQAVQADCARRISEDAAEITRLRAELPVQREP